MTGLSNQLASKYCLISDSDIASEVDNDIIPSSWFNSTKSRFDIHVRWNDLALIKTLFQLFIVYANVEGIIISTAFNIAALINFYVYLYFHSLIRYLVEMDWIEVAAQTFVTHLNKITRIIQWHFCIFT